MTCGVDVRRKTTVYPRTRVCRRAPKFWQRDQCRADYHLVVCRLTHRARFARRCAASFVAVRSLRTPAVCVVRRAARSAMNAAVRAPAEKRKAIVDRWKQRFQENPFPFVCEWAVSCRTSLVCEAAVDSFVRCRRNTRLRGEPARGAPRYRGTPTEISCLVCLRAQRS